MLQKSIYEGKCSPSEVDRLDSEQKVVPSSQVVGKRKWEGVGRGGELLHLPIILSVRKP